MEELLFDWKINGYKYIDLFLIRRSQETSPIGGKKTAGYDIKGNLMSRSDIGTFQYNHSTKPYAVTGLTASTGDLPLSDQEISYTSFKRVKSITESGGGYSADFTYNGKGKRVKMEQKKNGAKDLNRYYLSKCYELDDRAVGGTKEKLYLGGDLYTAPAVYVKEGSGNWNIYYFCRDYLGSITHITNSSSSD